MHASPEQRAGDNDSRIQSHGQGAGPPSPEAVERRAREIAMIEARAPDAVTEDDRTRAQRELHGQTLELSSDENRSDVVASSNPANIAVETGHKVENILPPDEQLMQEKEVMEGLWEAEHEHMFKGQNPEEEEKQ